MNESRLACFGAVVDAIYAGAESGGQWRGFLQRLREATGSRYAYMAVGNLQQWERCTWLIDGSGQGTQDHAAVRTDYLDLSPFARLPQDIVTTMGELHDSGCRVAPAFYSRVAQPYGIGDIMGTNFIRQGDQLAVFRVGRARDDDRYSREDTELCRLLLPHLHRSWERVAQNRHPAWKSVLSGVLQALGVGVVLVDTDCAILDASARALDIMNAHDDIFSARGGHLRLLRHADELQLRTALAQIDQHSADNAQSFAVASGSGPRRLHFVCRRMPEAVLADNPPCTAIFIRDDGPPRPMAVQTLRGLFGLTTAEARVASGLIGGLSMAQIAAGQGISRNTAYGHLKATFGKLGVNQQSALVSHVLGGLASFGRM
jgi:DNA-binding CsgD family transcriptional regulator